MTRQQAERRYAVRALCRGCRAPVLVGLDGQAAALLATVDPLPLGPQGEALAQLAGRWTYELQPRGRHRALARRDRWQIAGARVAGPGSGLGRRGDVLAEHRCGAEPLPGIPSQLPPLRLTERAAADAHPPF